MTLIDWDAIHAEIEKEKEMTAQVIARIETYVSTLPHTGLVYTKLEEEIVQGRFMVWIDKGIWTEHKYIDLSVMQ